MRKFTDFIMIPFVIFALVVLAVMGQPCEGVFRGVGIGV